MYYNPVEGFITELIEKREKKIKQKGIEKISEYLDFIENRQTPNRTVLLRKILDKALTERPYEAVLNATTIELIDTIQILLDISIAEITRPYYEIIRSVQEIEKTEDGVIFRL